MNIEKYPTLLEDKLNYIALNPNKCLSCNKTIELKKYESGSWQTLKQYYNRKYCDNNCFKLQFRVPENKKRCSRCKEIKDLCDFSPCSTGSKGLYAYCKECHRQIAFEQHPNRKEIDEKEARRIGLKKLGLKTCTSCKKVKNLEKDFYDDPDHSDGKWTWCIECAQQKSNKNYIKKEYGLSMEQYNLLLESQKGRCAICKRAPKKYKFNLDHDHKNQTIRGFLCVNCNTNILPYIEAYPDWINNAIKYLADPPAYDIIGRIEVPETNQSRVRERAKLEKKKLKETGQENAR